MMVKGCGRDGDVDDEGSVNGGRRNGVRVMERRGRVTEV